MLLCLLRKPLCGTKTSILLMVPCVLHKLLTPSLPSTHEHVYTVDGVVNGVSPHSSQIPPWWLPEVYIKSTMFP
jgi:hypothetical protein